MTYKEYFKIAIPFMLSTVTQPLLGAVDTGVIGRLDNPSYIGGVAIGTVIFNTMYWGFGFLKVSTSGFSAQSLGSNKDEDIYGSYLRPIVIALFISLILLVFNRLILDIVLRIYNPAEEVIEHAGKYFSILIWGAPCVLVGYVNLGWLMGRKLVKESLFLQISSNLINIVLDIVFVIYLKSGIAGVAAATLISQLYALILGMVFILKKLSIVKMMDYKNDVLDRASYKKIMSVNGDLFIRTVCLLIVTNMFVAKGAEFGVVALAGNSVLFQIQYIMIYMIAGMSNASSIFAGRAAGENNREGFLKVVKITTRTSIVISVVITIASILFRETIIGVFTTMDDVLDYCRDYYFWLELFPLSISLGMSYYGLYVGTTHTVPVRRSFIISLAAFCLCYYLVIPTYMNHGLWFSYILFSFSRTATLVFFKNSLIKNVFAAGGQHAAN